MFRGSFLVVLIIFGVSISLLTYSITLGLVLSFFSVNRVFAQLDVEPQDAEGQEDRLGDQQGPEEGMSTEQCPSNQHRVGSTNECEWDNCGSAIPPMYRNTQSGRCVSDCSEVGQFWVKQGNICVLGEASNVTSTQNQPSSSSIVNQSEASENVTARTDANIERPLDNASSSPVSNMSSIPSTLTQTVDNLAGEAAVPYACFSNTFTCYCDGTQDCKKLISSGECEADVRVVEGRPGLGECDWNANP